MKEIPGSEDMDVNVTCKSCGETIRVKLVDNRDDKSDKASFIAHSLAQLKKCPKCGGDI